MADIKYEIIEEIGVLSEGSKGWRKEINLVSWNGAKPKYDVRDWSPNHEKMGKGITLNDEEAKKLQFYLAEIGVGNSVASQQEISQPKNKVLKVSDETSDIKSITKDDLKDLDVLINAFKSYLVRIVKYQEDDAIIAAGVMKDMDRLEWVLQRFVGNVIINNEDYEVQYCYVDFRYLGLLHLANVERFKFYKLVAKSKVLYAIE